MTGHRLVTFTSTAQDQDHGFAAVSLLPQSLWQTMPSDAVPDDDVEESDSDDSPEAVTAAGEAASDAEGTVSVSAASGALEQQLQLGDSTMMQRARTQHKVWLGAL